jgi:hypothetical protein
MLSQDVRDALSAELEHLRIRRKKLTERIDQKIAAIEALLVGQDDDGDQIALPLGNPPGTSTVIGPLTGKGCREAIRFVLSSYPQLRPVEVAEKMKELGWAPKGTTPIKTRVSTELHRMRKEKLVTRKGNRISLLLPATSAQEPSANGS